MQIDLRRAPRPVRMLCTRVFPLIFVIGGFVMLGVGARALSHAYASTGWPTAPGTIVSSEIRESRFRDRGGHSTTYSPVLRYRYAIGDASFTGHRVASVGSGSSEREHAERTIERYPEGASVEVYYNPADLEVSLLEPGVSWGHFVVLGFGVVFVVMGVLVLVLLPRALRYGLSARDVESGV